MSGVRMWAGGFCLCVVTCQGSKAFKSRGLNTILVEYMYVCMYLCDTRENTTNSNQNVQRNKENVKHVYKNY